MKSRTEMSITASCLSPQLWTWIIAVCLLAALVIPICMAAQDNPSQELYAPQAGPASGGIQSDCLGRLGFPLRRPGLPPAIMNRLCKPMLSGRQTPQLSGDLAQNDQSGTIITFDVPGADLGTAPYGINPAGAVTGSYIDANYVAHGFVRAPDGTISTFDAPGGAESGVGTFAYAINPAGTITGYVFDLSGIHGFLRARGGSITSFDVPGAFFTQSVGINPSGTTTGVFVDLSGEHGFVRSVDGTFSTFDVPGYIIINLSGVINPAGAVTGYYIDSGFLIHSFVRDPDGTLTTFDGPSPCPRGNGTFANGINAEGIIVGNYFDSTCSIHGFMRFPDGTFTIVDQPGATASAFNAINEAGKISGSDNLGGNFLRAPNGTYTAYSIPGSLYPGDTAINSSGTIIGYYFDSQYVTHGFLRIPH
jgi:hypothetical protein